MCLILARHVQCRLILLTRMVATLLRSLLGNSNWARGHGEAGKDAAQAGQASVAQVAASLGE